MKTHYALTGLVTSLTLAISVPRAQAQLVVADSLDAAGISQLLEGLNVTISNVTVNCPGNAMGQFSGTSGLGMAQGLVLTTGNADALANPADTFASGFNNGMGDMDLTADAGVETFDACVLEFDCVPFGDTLLFNFSFGSEEYPEFVGSAFNDIFAIYLSGPDIPVPINVAQLPDGTPVAINNVNTAQNSAYFHDNLNPAGQYVAYDGFTQNLTAFAVVHPGDSYHFKVAIADASDMIYDSGVFLEAFSFRSVSGTAGVEGTLIPALGVTQQDGMVQVVLPPGHRGGSLLVIDAMGRTVKTVAVTGASAVFDAHDLPQGAYSVLLQDGSGLVPGRFVKQ
jgi:hypothetical protein